MIWLGDRRGHLSDWVTQRWVQLTGRRVALATQLWLAGPVGGTRGIGLDYFEQLAGQSGYALRADDGVRGLIPDFSVLAASDFDPDRVDAAVRAFYERTSTYELDAWSEWCGAFRPFGGLLAAMFSRRLQQLNVPLSSLDTSKGVTSEVLQVVDRTTNEVLYTAWVRRLLATGHALYVGSYSVCDVPGRPGRCLKVVFPLPNGNAMVIMEPRAHEDGSFSVVSAGKRFGDPGFYLTVRASAGHVWARYLRSLKESIRVYPDADGAGARADHHLSLWGARFLSLHYRMRPVAAANRHVGS